MNIVVIVVTSLKSW